MPNIRHIVVVDDDRETRALVCQFLEKHGFRATAVPDERSLQRVLSTQRVDLVVLDVMLGNEDGLGICKRLSAQGGIPIILLTGRGDEVDRIIGLEIGADDYVVKPFNPRELLARMRNVLRRWDLAPRGAKTQGGALRYRFGSWTLDAGARELLDAEGARQELTGAEYRLLLAFLTNPNRVLSRHELIELTRTRKTELFDRSIDVRVSRLRQLLRDTGGTSNLIKTVYGDGYVFSATVEVE